MNDLNALEMGTDGYILVEFQCSKPRVFDHGEATVLCDLVLLYISLLHNTTGGACGEASCWAELPLLPVSMLV